MSNNVRVALLVTAIMFYPTSLAIGTGVHLLARDNPPYPKTILISSTLYCFEDYDKISIDEFIIHQPIMKLESPLPNPFSPKAYVWNKVDCEKMKYETVIIDRFEPLKRVMECIE